MKEDLHPHEEIEERRWIDEELITEGGNVILLDGCAESWYVRFRVQGG